ncbi:ATP-binding protein [Streptomyces sp. NPDC002454]|uniref:ATP-binding protein n=1 Tax=unclassified Streptomyces TaxID=2593676 RepID=UPI003327EC11
MGMNGSTMLEPLRQGLPPIDPTAVSSSASCALPPHYEAVREARRFTRDTLAEWKADERSEDVHLVVSELVTNALRHALPQAGIDVDASGDLLPVRLHLMLWGHRLVCAVRDPSTGSPVTGYCGTLGSAGAAGGAEADAFTAAESGRGLFLVESFSDGWGWHPLAGAPGGKVVWALFRL